MDPQQQTKALLWGELTTLNWADVEKMYDEVDQHRQWASEMDAPPPERPDDAQV
jgi:hypothetical protein